MRAIVQTRFGSPDVLELRDLPVPVPKDDEVLIRVRAASLHADVWHVMRGRPLLARLIGAGLFKPKRSVPGTDAAGIVERVGSGVRSLQPGDEVYGEIVRGNQWHNGGAFAEFAVARASQLCRKPSRLSFEEAAAVPTSGLIALQGIREQGHVEPGQKVLINGAAGGVGAFAVQLARAYGADVTAVDSTDKLDMLRSLGADHVIDYTVKDFTELGERYDVILDIPGGHPFGALRRALAPTGTYVLIGHDGYGANAGPILGSVKRFLKLVVLSPFVSQRMNAGIVKTEDPLGTLTGFIDTGQLTPVIDRTYPLEQTAEAMRYLESGQVQGKVVITI